MLSTGLKNPIYLFLKRKHFESISLSSVIIFLTLFLVSLTPIFSVGELISIFNSTVKLKTSLYTPIYIKALKDILIIIIGLLGLVRIIIAGSYPKTYLGFGFILSFFLLTNVFITLFYSVAIEQELNTTLLLILSGIRWLYPVVLILISPVVFTKTDLRNLSKILYILFILHFCIQLFQLVFMPGFYGTILFGLSARVPGIFFIPNTAAFFTILVFYMRFYFSDSNVTVTQILAFSLSVVFTQSGTGIIVLLFFFILAYIPKKWIKLSLYISPFAGGVLLILVSLVIGRGSEYLQKSGIARLEIASRALSETSFFSYNFGMGTNSATLMSVGLVMDSQVASIALNMGYIGLILTFVAVFLVVRRATFIHERVFYTYLMIFVLFGLTTIFTEAFPMNIVFFVITSYLIDWVKSDHICKI